MGIAMRYTADLDMFEFTKNDGAYASGSCVSNMVVLTKFRGLSDKEQIPFMALRNKTTEGCFYFDSVSVHNTYIIFMYPHEDGDGMMELTLRAGMVFRFEVERNDSKTPDKYLLVGAAEDNGECVAVISYQRKECRGYIEFMGDLPALIEEERY